MSMTTQAQARPEPNAALRAVRVSLRHSQESFAAAIREAGDWLGLPNECAKRTVQMYESGRVRRPRASMLAAIEHVTGMPGQALGFDTAADAHGADSDTPMATEGPWIPVADPRVKPGPLSGIWLSAYRYPSTGRGAVLGSCHFVVLVQHGARVQARSVPGSASRLKMDMTLNGQVLNGTWAEETRKDGYYGGAVYYGAVHMTGDPSGSHIGGRWLGFGKGTEINDGPWWLDRVTTAVASDDISQFSREPSEEDIAQFSRPPAE